MVYYHILASLGKRKRVWCIIIVWPVWIYEVSILPVKNCPFVVVSTQYFQ